MCWRSVRHQTVATSYKFRICARIPAQWQDCQLMWGILKTFFEFPALISPKEARLYETTFGGLQHVAPCGGFSDVTTNTPAWTEGICASLSVVQLSDFELANPQYAVCFEDISKSVAKWSDWFSAVVNSCLNCEIPIDTHAVSLWASSLVCLYSCTAVQTGTYFNQSSCPCHGMQSDFPDGFFGEISFSRYLGLMRLNDCLLICSNVQGRTTMQASLISFLHCFFWFHNVVRDDGLISLPCDFPPPGSIDPMNFGVDSTADDKFLKSPKTQILSTFPVISNIWAWNFQ